jgi:hypothetical protein
MKWLVAVPCVRVDFLVTLPEFLAHPSRRAQPHWACCQIDAADESEAFDLGGAASVRGTLVGYDPSEYVPMNYFVAPLSEHQTQRPQVDDPISSAISPDSVRSYTEGGGSLAGTPLPVPDAHVSVPLESSTVEVAPEVRKWIVAVACVRVGFLDDPKAFLLDAGRRAEIQWACGVVDAVDESQAYAFAPDAWEGGELEGFHPDQHDVINWYVAPTATV